MTNPQQGASSGTRQSRVSFAAHPDADEDILKMVADDQYDAMAVRERLGSDEYDERQSVVMPSVAAGRMEMVVLEMVEVCERQHLS